MMPLEFIDYISPDGQVFTFDTGRDRFTLGEDGFGLPPIEYITQRGPDQHGETLLGYRLGTRIIQLTMRQDNCDRYAYWEARSALMDILRPNRQLLGVTGLRSLATGTLRRRFPDGSIRNLKVMVYQGPKFTVQDTTNLYDEYGYTEVIQFIAHDPIFFDPTLHSEVWTIPQTGQLQFPAQFPIFFGGNVIDQRRTVQYKGKWPSFPNFIVVGPLNCPSFTNETTNEKIDFDYNIDGGEIVTFSLSYGNKRVYNQVGTDLIGAVVDAGALSTFHLEPSPGATNGNNSILVTGAFAITSVSSVTMQYYDNYIGV